MNYFQILLVFLLGFIFCKSISILWEIIFLIKKINHYFFFFLTGFFILNYTLCHLLLSFQLIAKAYYFVNLWLLVSMIGMMLSGLFALYWIFFKNSKLPYFFLVISIIIFFTLPFPIFVKEPFISIKGKFIGKSFQITYLTPNIMYYICKINIFVFFSIFTVIKFLKSTLPLKFKILGLLFLFPGILVLLDVIAFLFLKSILLTSEVWSTFYQIVKFLIFSIIFLVPNVESYLSINNRLKKMKKKNIKLEKMVQARTSELEEQNKQKTDLFINLTHEFKTPLTLIQNYFRDYYKENQSDRRLKIIKYNIDKLINDVEKFFDERKLELGKIKFFHDQILNLSTYTENTVSLYKDYTLQKKILIKYKIDSDLFIKADPDAINIIVTNLMDNAVKYSKSGGVIHVNLQESDNFINFSVTDNGIGIVPDKLEKIFLPYYQITHKKKNIHGIGMGLALVKNILDQLGAKINVTSTREKGTCFSIIFNKHELKDDDSLHSGKMLEPIFKPIVTLEKPSIKIDRYTILIVEDNDHLLAFLVESLKGDYNVLFAENGLIAMKLLEKEFKIDIIITDIMMDEMDGYQFAEKLRNNSLYTHIPLIFLTAKMSIDEKLYGLKSGGAIDFISKPFSIDEVKTKIENILVYLNKAKENEREIIKNEITNLLNQKKNIKTEQSIEYKNVQSIFSLYHFSKREKEVFRHLFEGKSNKEISFLLKLSTSSIKKYVFNIFRKFNVNSRLELMNKIYKGDALS